MSDQTKTTVGTVIFLALMAGIFYFAATDRPAMVLVIIGFIFFGCGLLGIIKEGITGDSWWLLLVLLIGGGTMVIALSYVGVPFLAGIRNNDSILPTLLCAFFIVAGLILFLSACYMESRKKERCFYPVQAQCIAIDSRDGGGYVVTRKYTYHGKEYCCQPSDRFHWWHNLQAAFYFLPELDESYPLMINPSKPEEAYSPVDKSLKIQKFMGMAQIAFGILAFYFAFYK